MKSAARVWYHLRIKLQQADIQKVLYETIKYLFLLLARWASSTIGAQKDLVVLPASLPAVV